MPFRGMEDRLNPIAPPDADEATLGGYAAVHGRAAGFEGSDGRAYTAAVEVDRTEGGDDEWAGYIVFVRWGAEGSAIMGHLETEDLVTAATPEDARRKIDELPLAVVKQELEKAIARKREWEDEAAGPEETAFGEDGS